MDPGARRDMWRVISRMVSGDHGVSDSEKTSVILTTHSMEECEALCSRIAIMAGGKIRCLGSAQHLKSRFGKGWQVEVKLLEVGASDEDYKQAVSSFMRSKGSIPISDEEVGDNVNVTNLVSDSGKKELSFNMDETLAALNAIEGNNNCSSMINEDDPNGYLIWKDAKSSVGVNVTTLAYFYAQESRVAKFVNFIVSMYPETCLRERNYNRYGYISFSGSLYTETYL
jgi:ABC-type multidrug transport system ATPase subunit